MTLKESLSKLFDQMLSDIPDEQANEEVQGVAVVLSCVYNEEGTKVGSASMMAGSANPESLSGLMIQTQKEVSHLKKTSFEALMQKGANV